MEDNNLGKFFFTICLWLSLINIGRFGRIESFLFIKLRDRYLLLSLRIVIIQKYINHILSEMFGFYTKHIENKIICFM